MADELKLPPGLSLRPIGEADLPFLARLYGTTRVDELELTDWSAEQKEAFVAQQFAAQHHHYQTYYAGAAFDLVMEDDRPIGRLYVARWTREIRLVDVALVPEVRGRGLGTALVQALLDEGERTGKAVSIHVEMYNPALRLYDRLGFRKIGEKGPYYLMEWQRSGADAGAATPASG